MEKMVITMVCIMVVSLLWKALSWVWWRPKKLEKYLKQQGLKGTSYKLLFGDTKQAFQLRDAAKSKPISFSDDYVPRILPFLQQTVINHGKISFTWMGPIPMVNIMEPELIREVLSRVYDFQKIKVVNPLMKLLASGIICYDGEKWAQHRKMMSPAFHISKLKAMLPAFTTSSIEMLNKWEEKINETGCCELDVWPYLHIITSNATSRATFGAAHEEGRRIFTLIKEQIALVAPMRESIYIPGSRFLPTRTNKILKKTHKEIEESLGRLITARKKEVFEASKVGATSNNEDLLGSMMESLSDQQELIDVCKLFYLAGEDSTATLLVWTMILLSKHQDWQASARQEVLNTFGRDNEPDIEGLNHLKIVTMILNEVLRLYPPVTMILRSVIEETKLENFSLPAGSLVNLPVLLVNHDHEVWGDDAKEFNPERFSQGISKATLSGKHSLFSFSYGPRYCIGQNFALIEAKIALVMILRRFSFELSPSYIHAPSVALILQPQFGAPVILNRL